MHTKQLIAFSFSMALCSAPFIVLAQVGDVFGAEIYVFDIIGSLSQLLWGVAIMVFFWGLIKFINNAADTKAHEEGKNLIVWGLISFLVLVSLWGIVQLVAGDMLGYTAGPIKYIDKDGNPIP